MPFEEGNKFWLARSKHGRDKIFESKEALWEACCEYFEWVESNPLWEDKVSFYQGIPTHDKVAKMRAMTIGGLCFFLNITLQTWTTWRAKDHDFSDVVARVDQVIYEQKLTGAAADLLNSNIIARELGLADKQDHTSSDGSMSPKGKSLEDFYKDADVPSES